MKNAFNLAGSRTDPNMMSIEHVERRMRPVRSSACRNYVHGPDDGSLLCACVRSGDHAAKVRATNWFALCGPS